tara:strand:+ start:1280 stop:1741 length:462 start_codon:yes stop_codon:yes gene_type:complete
MPREILPDGAEEILKVLRGWQPNDPGQDVELKNIREAHEEVWAKLSARPIEVGYERRDLGDLALKAALLVVRSAMESELPRKRLRHRRILCVGFSVTPRYAPRSAAYLAWRVSEAPVLAFETEAQANAAFAQSQVARKIRSDLGDVDWSVWLS